jgi:hypothetical protein
MIRRVLTWVALACSVLGVFLALSAQARGSSTIGEREARAYRIGQTQEYFACKPHASCSSCASNYKCSSDANYWICVEGTFADKCTWSGVFPDCGFHISCDPGCLNCAPPSADPCRRVGCVH